MPRQDVVRYLDACVKVLNHIRAEGLFDTGQATRMLAWKYKSQSPKDMLGLLNCLEAVDIMQLGESVPLPDLERVLDTALRALSVLLIEDDPRFRPGSCHKFMPRRPEGAAWYGLESPEILRDIHFKTLGKLNETLRFARGVADTIEPPDWF